MHRFRYRYLVALLVFALSVAACGNKDDASNDKKNDSTTADKGKESTSSATAGEKLESDAGRFNVQFPDGFPTAKEDTKDVPTKIGTLKMHTFLTELSDAACMIAYSDYPEEAFKGADIDALLDSARNGALNNVHGTMETEEKIEMNGHPGRSIIFTGNSGGTTIHGRFDYYLVKPRLYQIGYMALSKEKVAESGVMAYFKSFGVTATEPAEGSGK